MADVDGRWVVEASLHIYDLWQWGLTRLLKRLGQRVVAGQATRRQGEARNTRRPHADTYVASGRGVPDGARGGPVGNTGASWSTRAKARARARALPGRAHNNNMV